jgi:hypothetical protein
MLQLTRTASSLWFPRFDAYRHCEYANDLLPSPVGSASADAFLGDAAEEALLQDIQVAHVWLCL